MSRAAYIEIPGSGRVRVTTRADVKRAVESSQPVLVPSRSQALISRPGKALTASASRAQDARGALLRLDQGWQRQAMRVYETQGECANPAQYQGRAMERIRYYPALLNERGVPEESNDPKLLALFNRIRTPGGAPGDLSELAGVYARLQFVIGDGLLTVSDDDGEVWEYLSPMEMRMQPRTGIAGRPQEYRRLRAPGIQPEELAEATDENFTGEGLVRVSRLWRKDIEFTQRAFSPVKPILDDYELLGRLTLAVAAEASSRAAQRGLLFLPSELSFGPADPTQEENPEEDPLMRELQESMARAIRDPGSAEAMAPFVIRAAGLTQSAGGAVPTAELIKWIALGPNDRYTEGEMWDKTIARIAGSIDMPQELMTGVGGVSHWTSWFLGSQGFTEHTGPTLVRFCNDMGSAYLRPAAIEEGITNADRVIIWYDASAAINHPDETGTALKAHDQLIYSDAYAREKLGAPESAAPGEKELARRVAIKLREFPSDLQPRPTTGATSPADGGTGADVSQGPPQPSTRRQAPNKAPSPQGPSLAAMIAGAAVMQVDRARELAGNKLVRYVQSCGECQDTIKEVKTALVAAALGPDQVRAVLPAGKTETILITGVGTAFADRLVAWGVDGGWPVQLGQMVEQHALRTLYEVEVPALPAGFMAACEKAIGGSDGHP